MILQTSVIIVSRHRPAALLRAIAALRQQDHANFELIVVADPAAIAGLAQDIKKIPFDEANISAARNLGLAVAAGDIVAFIDDDAVAEPTWITRLTAPFANADVMASTGFIRGRNGISWQWRACEVDHLGQDHPFDVTHLTLRGPTPRVVKTQGTNCAFRTDALRAIGGFDPAYRFYLDEADVNLRMACLTAIVPMAEVHHGYLASARRRPDRLPLTLFDIAASTAVFLRRHAPDDISPARLIAHQTQRLAAWQKAGKMTQSHADELLASLTLGWQNGLAQDLRGPTVLARRVVDFLPLGGIGPRAGVVFAGRIWSHTSLRKQAETAVLQGQIATVICLSPTIRAHRVEFDPAGFWLQQGGIWGRTDRSAPRIIWGRFSRRIAQEIARIKSVRPISCP
jgi:GT2 family glycosyltransferase